MTKADLIQLVQRLPDAAVDEAMARLRELIPEEAPGGDWRHFAELAEQWKQDSAHLSSAARIAEHPAYRKIVSLGRTAVPLILADLEREPAHWFMALHEITGANPVPPESRGRIDEMAAAWLAWGRQNGYVW